MAVIRPFQAIRPSQEYGSEVAALPYDVYSREEAYEFVQDKPLSFLNIDRPETQFPKDFDMYSEEAYQKAKDLIGDFMNRSILLKEDKACFYLYALTMGGRTQTGLVACSSVDDYVNEVTLKHENTRADKELDRIHHVDTCSCQTGPIFLAYRDSEVINEITGNVMKTEALFDFVSEDGIRHQVWKISEDEKITKIVDGFSGIKNTYIADGHHRAASAVKVALKRRETHPDYDGTEEFNFYLSVLFPQSQLKILDYNRVVKDLNGLSEEMFLQKIGEVFTIDGTSNRGEYLKPEIKGTVGMFLKDTWYHLTLKPEFATEDPIKGLDVSLLQDLFLAPVLGIQDPKTDDRIGFIGGIRGLKELERRVKGDGNMNGDMAVAFAMFPTSMDELFNVADHGLLMPPKSTWFEPKLRSGLFLHEIEK